MLRVRQSRCGARSPEPRRKSSPVKRLTASPSYWSDKTSNRSVNSGLRHTAIDRLRERAHQFRPRLLLLVKTLAIRSTMEEMMVSRRAVLQSQAEKVSRNWAEESGMRQFIAVSRRSSIVSRSSKARPETAPKFPGVL